MIEKFHAIIHVFLEFDRTLIGMRWEISPRLINNFPRKATTTTATQTNNNSSILFSYVVHLIYLSDSLIARSQNHKADAELHN